MPRSLPMVALLLASCGGPGGSDDDPATPAAVGEVSFDGTVTTASCREVDHPLMARCTLTTESSSTVWWTLREAGDEVRTFTTEGTTHEQLLWGLAEGTAYTWEATTDGGSASGTLTAGTVDLGELAISAVGRAPALDSVLVPLQCTDTTGLVAFDGQGRITWYQVLGPGSSDMRGGINGFDVGPDGFVAVVEGEQIAEVAPDGTLLRDLVADTLPLHHDLAVDDDGRIYVLDADEVDGYILDGVEIFDGEASVARFDLADVLTPTGTTGGDMFWASEFPGAVDWAHTNSVELGPDGTALLSLKAQNAVMQVVLDPDAADFGAVDWVLTGDDSQLTSDLAWPDGGGFYGQHHVSWSREGELLLFDNGTGSSRGLVVEVDLAAGEATELRSVAVGGSCPVQGSTYELPDGGLLTTCGNSGELQAFDASGQATWSATVSCGSRAPLARGLPLDWGALGF